MIKIAVQTGGIEFDGIDNAYRVIAEAGFDAVDANVDHLLTDIWKHNRNTNFDSPENIRSAFEVYRASAEKYGLMNYQAHAPFPSYVAPDPKDPDYNDYLLRVLQGTIRGCDHIGCRNLIVHPFFLNYTYHMTAQDEWDLNIESYSKLIPAAKEYGVTVCLENMFGGYKGRIMSACCSDMDVTNRYIDTLNGIAGEERFGFCLDTGHLNLLGLDIEHAMVALGSRIKAFHVHDNNGLDDQHLPPYMGMLDWDAFVRGLAAIRYDSVMSFETFNLWNVMDRELCPQAMKLLASCGRMFARRAAAE